MFTTTVKPRPKVTVSRIVPLPVAAWWASELPDSATVAFLEDWASTSGLASDELPF